MFKNVIIKLPGIHQSTIGMHIHNTCINNYDFIFNLEVSPTWLPGSVVKPGNEKYGIN